MQQATVNLLADMGSQPATPQSGLVPATKSTDTSPPTSTITAPSSGSTVTVGSPITISGIAVDFGGGVVAAVEVSLDGGQTWHPAVGRENWSYSATFRNSGALGVQSRAVDDSGNLEVPVGGITFAAAPQPCPCTIWSATAAAINVDAGPDSPIELGVSFRSDVNGYIAGIRFYKSVANTGTHVGSLWSSAGALLATATFTSETNSGWQQVNFSQPVAITANTVYVASYHSTGGHYSADWGHFSASGVDNAPLHAFANGLNGATDGLFVYSTVSAFPTNTYSSSNYWVDVVFTNSPNLAVTSASLPKGTQSVSYSQSLFASGGNTPYAWSLLSGSLPVGLTLSSGGLISGTPTAAGVFDFTVQLTDSSNPQQTASVPLRIVVTTSGSCPCTIWPDTATPTNVDIGPDSAAELGVTFRADTNGYITGIRFYKSAGNTGAHAGNLWTSTGILLATATFTAETASGWQQVNFSSPGAITANTVYVASYYSMAGHYSADWDYFLTSGADNAPLHGLADTSAGPNGVFAYGSASVFPGKHTSLRTIGWMWCSTRVHSEGNQEFSGSGMPGFWGCRH